MEWRCLTRAIAAPAYEPAYANGHTVLISVKDPAINGNAQLDAAVITLYASYLPTTSVQAVNALLSARLADGSPIAELIDVDYVFLAAIVNLNAAH